MEIGKTEVGLQYEVEMVKELGETRRRWRSQAVDAREIRKGQGQQDPVRASHAPPAARCLLHASLDMRRR